MTQIVNEISSFIKNLLNKEYMISELYTIIGSITVALITEKIVSNINSTRQEFDGLRMKISTALINEACFYSNPINYSNCSDAEKERYATSSATLRILSSELMSFTKIHNKFKYKGIKSIDIQNASSKLLALSNIYGMSIDERMAGTGMLMHLDKEIKDLLKI